MARPTDPAIAELVKLRPSKLRVYVRDSDEPKSVAMPATRKKWEKLSETLDALDWERVEALDGKGNVIGVVSAADTLDDVDVDASDVDERLERYLALMLKAQQVALTAQRDMLQPLLHGVQTSVAVMTDALQGVAQMYRLALATATTLPEGGGKDGSDEALARFMQTVMMLRMGAPATPPNGAPPKRVAPAPTPP